jgi:predicted O-methyltransferase YrrM
VPERLTHVKFNKSLEIPCMSQTLAFSWAESLFPERLKSPWWIGHIPFAFELIGRAQPRTVVELGTYSGSSFAAFCQAVEASGGNSHVYGVDLWQGDVHMGSFDEDLYQEMAQFAATRYPGIATLIRKDFNEAAASFADGAIDLLHIDGTHTYEAVMNDFTTWLPKMSERGIILFHDINVTEQNAGPSAAKFGVRAVFDKIKASYRHCEFEHCFGLGVLAVGASVPASAVELLDAVHLQETRDYFANKGQIVSKHFESLGIALPQHGAYGDAAENGHLTQAATLASLWRRALRKLRALTT